jgi:hypothetical protein
MKSPLRHIARFFDNQQMQRALSGIRAPLGDDVIAQTAIDDFEEAVDFLGFTFVEIFLTEQQNDIRQCVFGLFPELRWDEDLNVTLASLGTRIDHGHFYNIGRIQIEGKHPLTPSRRIMTGLPDPIEYIDVTLRAHLDAPSLVFISFHAAFNQSVSRSLADILCKRYRPRPTRSRRFRNNGIQFRNPTLDRQDDIDLHVAAIERGTMERLRPYLKGGYFKSIAAKLPTLEIFGIRALPQAADPEWMTKTRDWRGPLGLEIEFFGWGGAEGKDWARGGP